MYILGGLIKRTFKLADRLQGLKMSPMQLQEKTLRRLLKKAEFTEFGIKYNFSDILRSNDIVKTYQDKVPFYDYDSIFEAWWHRSLEGKPDVAWPGITHYFALSSGTTGTPSKHLPMTEDMIKAIRKSGLKTFYSLTKYNVGADFFLREGLTLGGSTALKPKGKGIFVGDMSGINIKKTPFWLSRLARPGKKVASIPDWNKRIDEIARLAPTWDIGYIAGIPSWMQLMIERVVAYNGVNNIHDIWPNLQLFVHGGIAFEPHRKSFDALMGKPMFYIDTYLASEGFIAFQNRPDTKAMALILNNGIFHEFIPFNEQNFDSEGNIIGKPKALSINEVQEGVDYAIIISTCAGSWRYLIGDTVRFTDTKRKEIIITGRTKQFISVVGEHLSVGNMNQAIAAIQDKFDTRVREFTVAPVRGEDGAFRHRWYIGCETPVDKLAATELIDKVLCDVNDDYATERGSVLRQPEVFILDPQPFFEFLKSKGKVGGQAKFPRVMKKAHFEEWENFVANFVK